MNHSNNKKIKVLYLITRSNWGGAQRYVYDLASQLNHDQFSIAVAGGGTGERGAPAGKLNERLTSIDLPFHYLSALHRSINPLSELRAQWQIIRCIQKVRPDVVHLNSTKIAALGGLLARLLGVRTIVFTVHGFPYTAHQTWILRWLANRVTALTFLCATNIICICQADHALAQTYWSARGKLHLIPNGIDATYPSSPSSTAREQLTAIAPSLEDVDTHVPLVATGTELHPRKGIQNVIAASANCLDRGDNFHLCIIGTGPYQNNLEQHVHEYGIEKHVTFLGFVQGLPEICPAFSGFALASYKEGLPYVLLELGRGRVPLIASNIDGIPDIITHESTGQLIDPHDTATITGALHNLLTEPVRYEQQANRLAAHISQTFDIATMASKTSAVYTTTLT